MVGQIEEGVDLGDGHALRRLSYLHDLVAGADLAFFQHAKVEAGAAMEMSSAGIRGSFIRMPTR